MTLPVAVLRRMVADGCTAAQLLGAIEAEEEHRRDRLALLRAARIERDSRQALGGTPAAGERDSRVPLVIPLDGSRSSALDASRHRIGPRETGAKANARFVLLHRPELTPAARAVGAALVERYNLDTGRCDPPMELLRKDSGLRRGRSVRRAVAELVGAGFVSRVVNGGAHHCNAYELHWEAFAASARALENQRLLKRDSTAEAGLFGPDQRDSLVPPNLEKKPRITAVQVERQRQTQRAPDRRQGFLPLPFAGGKAQLPAGAAAPGDRQQPVADEARASAFRRVMAAFVAEPPAKAFLRQNPLVLDVAVQAEMERLGQGIADIRVVLERRGIGPPRKAAG